VTGPLLALAPMRIEAAAVRKGTASADVWRTGIGLGRAGSWARTARPRAGAYRAVAVTGIGGALVDSLALGDVVVADRVLEVTGAVVAELPGAALVASALRRDGLSVRVGPVVSSPRLVDDDSERHRLATDLGAVAVDMESSALLSGDWGRPLAVVRTVSDRPGQRFASPATLVGVGTALRSLSRCGPGLERWAAASGTRRVVLAGPRSFCAGVERAVATVSAALARYGAPLYVRRHIVHNSHVVAELEAQGAVFVRELDEVPDGATVVFSAHGVAPAVRAEATRRGLGVVDATCPLVAKVHGEIRRFAERGFQVVLVGHAGHDEIEGSLGEAADIALVATVDDVAALSLDPDRPVAYTTQTTLAPDQTAAVVAALAERFPGLAGPAASDICYATQNRQEAVVAIAPACDVVLVVGSPTSSNSRRLAEVVERTGTPAHLIDDASELDLDWLTGASCVGLTAGASAPESLVAGVLDALASLGPLEVHHEDSRRELVTFSLPQEVR